MPAMNLKCQNFCVNILKQPLGNCLQNYLYTISDRQMRFFWGGGGKEITDVKKQMRLLQLIKHQSMINKSPQCLAAKQIVGSRRNTEGS